MSRIAKLCSWCGAAIPDSLRLSAEEIRRVQVEEAAAKDKLKAMEDARAVRDEKKAMQEFAAEHVAKQVLRHLE